MSGRVGEQRLGIGAQYCLDIPVAQTEFLQTRQNCFENVSNAPFWLQLLEIRPHSPHQAERVILRHDDSIDVARP
jgi:hypothetical protein